MTLYFYLIFTYLSTKTTCSTYFDLAKRFFPTINIHLKHHFFGIFQVIYHSLCHDLTPLMSDGKRSAK